MKIIILAVLAFIIAGCTTPSTMLVNREGKVMRCAAMGYGNLVAIGIADQMHSRCVEDARIVGFVPIPMATLGFHGDMKNNNPMRVIEVNGQNAQAAGLRVGDVILEIDSKPVETYFAVINIMNTKKVGDRVSVKVRRDQEVLPLTIVAAAR
jgi:membrane-associated protease RseP (regulator of RpoE activity)